MNRNHNPHNLNQTSQKNSFITNQSSLRIQKTQPFKLSIASILPEPMQPASFPIHRTDQTPARQRERTEPSVALTEWVSQSCGACLFASRRLSSSRGRSPVIQFWHLAFHAPSEFILKKPYITNVILWCDMVRYVLHIKRNELPQHAVYGNIDIDKIQK